MSIPGQQEVLHRSGHQHQGDLPGIEDLDDISYSDDTTDDDSDYGADKEDNDEYPDERAVIKDPGCFRYNKKMIMVSLPCAVMVMTLVGELFLIAASFGAGIILILDPKGEKRRCVILYTILFVCCHAFTIFSILPLLWLSILNIFLIGVVNMYVILTGGLIALQFAYVRKYELKIALTIEKMLFSLYPWCCVILLTWTSSAVVNWEILPYVFITIGFVYLQLFIAPHSSSFKVENKVEKPSVEDEFNVVPEAISLLMAIVYCTAPACLHMFLHLVNNPFRLLFSFTVLMHLIFILSLSVFLTSLMSLRAITDYTGWQYKYIYRGRWVSGSVCTTLVYPVLIHYQLSSHFLPWLPAGIAIYALYGALLSDKRFMGTSLMLLPLPCLLFGYWLTWLPWKIVLTMIFGLEVQVLYVLLMVNCVLCFLCAYTSSYGSEQTLPTFLSIESAVFTLCEVMLYNANLYTQTFLVVTATIVLYTLHRLHIAGKIGSWSYTFCSALHLTKVLVVVIYNSIAIGDTFNMYRAVTLFALAVVLVRVVALEEKIDRSVKEVIYNTAALCAAILINSNPILRVVCVYVLWEEPSLTDILDLGVILCGVSIVLVGSLQMPQEYQTFVRQLGAIITSFGVLVLILQPSVSFSLWSLLQWGDVWSVILVACVLLTDTVKTLPHLATCAIIVGVCPAIRMATLMYAESDELNVGATFVRSLVYIPACISLAMILFMFIKLDVRTRQLEKLLLVLCCVLGMLSALLLFIDIGLSDKEPVMSLPVWKLSAVTAAVVSFSLKILSTTNDLLIPLVEEKTDTKRLLRLPLIGNVSCMVALSLCCALSPVKGLLHDIWCCGASLLLLCLQKDGKFIANIKKENQIVPTIFTCIIILLTSSICRSDLWDSSGLSLLRSLIEIFTILCTLPKYYILWGILWQDKLIMSEQWVVFLVPLHGVYLLYGSSFSSQALALVGLYSGIWMMVMRLPLTPHRTED